LPKLSTHLRSRIGKVCVALTGATAAEMIEKASAAAKETPFLEFRLDYLDKPAAAMPKLRAFLAEHSAVTAIATCRRAENGGRFEGTVAAELEILLKAAEPAAPGEEQAAFQLVDLEVESAEALKKGDLAKLRQTEVAVIVSYHNFRETKDLESIYQRMVPFDPDVVKIVPTAKSLTDNVTLMRFIERISDDAAIVGICMGDAGIISRVLGLRAGSAFTFAAANQGDETGPGQIAARTLVETYRIEEVDAATKVYGVAGNPVNRSLSPIMMNTAFRRETVNAVYLALQTEKIEDLVGLIGQIPIHGVSVTMPHKQTILPYLEHMDPLSAKIGAVNTVSRVEGKLYGFNTDVAGILVPLEKRLAVRGAKVLVLGAGGSARAAVFALRDKGADVFILNRTPEIAAKLAKQSGAKVIKREAVSKTTFDVILNATPVGMAGNSSPQILGPDDLKTKIVFDLVYNPIDTPLIRLARQQNLTVITGVEMFVQQGARQFEIWTGKPAPEDEMLRVVIHALKQQAEASAAAVSPTPDVAPTPEGPEPGAVKKTRMKQAS
jgi:3-dehydroquinate dehydratase/shikimate dehydrogenase